MSPSVQMPATPLRMSGATIPRRALAVGDRVTDEDPTSLGYRHTGRIVSFIPAGEEFSSDPLLAVVDYGGRCHQRRTRSEIRSVYDKPTSAQIGFGAVWEASPPEVTVVECPDPDCDGITFAVNDGAAHMGAALGRLHVQCEACGSRWALEVSS